MSVPRGLLHLLRSRSLVGARAGSGLRLRPRWFRLGSAEGEGGGVGQSSRPSAACSGACTSIAGRSVCHRSLSGGSALTCKA
eukprot:3753725-Pyramimonas_sp.AAC.1